MMTKINKLTKRYMFTSINDNTRINLLAIMHEIINFRLMHKIGPGGPHME